MWRWYPAILLLFLYRIHSGNSLTVYYRRKAELGYYSMYLFTMKKPSSIQCASACSFVNGCSAISFSSNQTLCKLSSGQGMYIADPEWTTLFLHIDDKTITTPQTMVSRTIEMTTITSQVLTSSSTVVTTTQSDAITSQTIGTFSTESPTTTTRNALKVNGLGGGSGKSCPAGYTMTSSGYCFEVLASLHSFTDFRKMCMMNGGYLATIGSKYENMEVIGLLQARSDLSTDVFIGASDDNVEGTWRWLNGDPFIGWMNGLPTNFHPDADCLAYSFSNGWQWTDVLCAQTAHSVCETEPI